MRPGTGGNRRAGWYAGGVILLMLGFGVGVIANLLLHAAAPVGQCVQFLPGFWVCNSWGWYATVVLVLGLFATLVGVGMVALAVQMPRAPLRLFDTEGRYPPDPSEP